MSKFLKSIIVINCAVLLAALGLLLFHMNEKTEAKNLVGENFYGEKIYLDDDDYEYASSRNNKKGYNNTENPDKTKKFEMMGKIILTDL